MRLLEPDPANPGVRYFALRDLLARSPHDPEVMEVQAAVMAQGPVPAILAAQHPDDYWEKPGGGYGKYRGTVWQIMLLAELGADPADVRVRRGCDYLLDHSLAQDGGFAATQGRPVPSSVIHCLNGNLLHALIRLGQLANARVQQAVDWQARADYPYSEKVSSAWFKLGFPLSYWSDVLETLAVLAALGYGQDARLAGGWAWLLGKQDGQGRWKLENALNGKMWIEIERRGRPSKWVTLRVLRALKAAA